MIIEHLALTDFRRFENLEITAVPGLNVIRGDNEAGKSTVVAALIAGLFFSSNKSGQEIERLKRWGSDRLYTISLQFMVADARFTLKKDFDRQTVLLRGPGVSIDTDREVLEKITDFTGFSSPALYTASAAIQQDKIAEMHGKKSELSKVLQELVSSGTEDINIVQIVNALQRKIVQLKRGMRQEVSDPGPLRMVKDEYDTKIAQYSEKKSQQETRIAKAALAEKLRKQLTQLTAELSDKRKLLTTVQSARALQQELTTIKEQFTALEQNIEGFQSLGTRRDVLQRTLDQFREWQNIDIAQLARTVNDKASQLSMLRKTFSQHSAPETFSRGHGRLHLLYYILSATSTLVGILGFFFSPYFFGGFLGTVLFVVLAVTEQRFMHPHLISVSGHEHSDLAEAKKIELEIAALLQKLSVQNIEEFSHKQQLYLTATAQLAEIDQLMENQKIGDVATLQKKRSQLAADQLAREEKLQALGAAAHVAPEAAVALEQGVSQLTQQQASLQSELVATEAVLESIPATDDLSDLEQEILVLRKNFELLKRQQEVYTLTCEYLQEAQRHTMHSVRDVLQQEIAKFLPRITGDRYRDVAVGPNLEITVRVPETGEFIEPKDHLSRGTIDQIYLVARFALVRAMSENKRPPIVLDDPFVTFDESRKRATMTLLKELAKDFQIFLLTYDEWYDQFADHVTVVQ